VIVDFSDPRVGDEHEADLCIVGAGAAGIALGLELASMRVIVLDGGGESPAPAGAGELRGLPCLTVLDGRARGLGGTTSLWAGQALPFEPADLAVRDWVPDSGWPIPAQELSEPYRRAERLLGLPNVTYDERGWPPGLPLPPTAPGLKRRFSTFAPVPNLAHRHDAHLRAGEGPTMLLHAQADRLMTNGPGDEVQAIAFRSPTGRVGRVVARAFILAAGAVETARLLLASTGPRGHAVGNRHDQVGRFFQEHLHLNLRIVDPDRRRLAQLLHGRRLHGVRHFAKLSASPQLQREERLLAVGANVSYDPDASAALRAIRELRRRAGRPVPAAVFGALVRHPDHLVRAGYRSLRGTKASEGFGDAYLAVQVETAPRPESRVTLGSVRDALGMPEVCVDWRVGEPELRTAEVFAGRLDELLRAHRLGRVDPAQLRLPRELTALAGLVDAGAHHCGTARMSDDPRHGVVDRDCRVHGIGNLYIAGSAVFPTSSWSNPTLTLLALSYRLADHVRDEFHAPATRVGSSVARGGAASRGGAA